jgi:hypothetical protein
MKKIRIIPLILIAGGAVIGIDIIRTKPDPRWNSIHPGMKLSSVIEKLGKPEVNLQSSKGIQIWNRSGILRTTSIALFYYDQNNPDIVTGIQPGEVWIIERL